MSRHGKDDTYRDEATRIFELTFRHQVITDTIILTDAERGWFLLTLGMSIV